MSLLAVPDAQSDSEMDPGAPPRPSDRLTVQVIRSPRRHKTTSGRVVGDKIQIRIPAWASAEEERAWVDNMADKLRKQVDGEMIDLVERSTQLASRFGLETPDSIRWVSNQNTLWGSCSPAARTIRISHNLVAFPRWVLDYVLVHEMAHLTVCGHNDEFWELVHRYPKAERAIGYLIARADDLPR